MSQGDDMNILIASFAAARAAYRLSRSIKDINGRHRACRKGWLDTRVQFARISLSLLGLLATPVQAQMLRVWGDDASRQISDAPDGKFKAVAGGSINGLALRWDWTPVLWGEARSDLSPSPTRSRPRCSTRSNWPEIMLS